MFLAATAVDSLRHIKWISITGRPGKSRLSSPLAGRCWRRVAGSWKKSRNATSFARTAIGSGQGRGTGSDFPNGCGLARRLASRHGALDGDCTLGCWIPCETPLARIVGAGFRRAPGLRSSRSGDEGRRSNPARGPRRVRSDPCRGAEVRYRLRELPPGANVAETFTSGSRAGVAQLVEHLPSKQDVAGSNPVSRSIPLVEIGWLLP